MKHTNTIKTGIIFALFSVALMSNLAFAQEASEAELQDEIVQQGDTALNQMQFEFKQNAFWKSAGAEQLANQLETQAFVTTTAASTDCDKNSILVDEKKTPTIAPVTTEQPG